GPSETATGSMAGNGIARNGIGLQRKKSGPPARRQSFPVKLHQTRGSSALPGRRLRGRGTAATVVPARIGRHRNRGAAASCNNELHRRSTVAASAANLQQNLAQKLKCPFSAA